jgi:hypothetical protein
MIGEGVEIVKKDERRREIRNKSWGSSGKGGEERLEERVLGGRIRKDKIEREEERVGRGRGG